jgi:beta-galactosidase
MTKISLDRGWKFHKGDIPNPEVYTHTTCYMAAKAGGALGAASIDCDHGSWEDVDLPHDWAVENPFDEKYGPANGYKARGKGWYSKVFRLDEADADKQLIVEFGGVASHCVVYLNGSVVYRNFGGYNSFVVDITDMALFGDKLNTLSVFVDATVIEGWWYEGAGIYRHVDLYKYDMLHIDHRGVFVHPEKLDPGTWDTKVETDVENLCD